MSRLIDLQVLTEEYYKDANRCDARTELHSCFSMNPHGCLDWDFDTLIHPDVDAQIPQAGSGSAACRLRPGEIYIPNVPRPLEAVKEEHS